MTEMPHWGSWLDAQVKRRVAVALSTRLSEKLSTLLQDKVNKCVEGLVPSVPARIPLLDIIRAAIARRGLAGIVPEGRVMQTRRWDKNSDYGPVGDLQGPMGRNGTNGSTRDLNSDTDSTTSSEWEDFSFDDIISADVTAEETQSPFSEFSASPDPFGNCTQAADYGGTEETVLSLNSFSATDLGNTGAHAAQYGTPRKDTVPICEAQGVVVARSVSYRRDDATSVPIGIERDPRENVRQQNSHSRPSTSKRVAPCDICLSVYGSCCIGLS